MDHVCVARRLPPTHYAQPAGAKIAYQVSGEGPCDLVFVPGLVSHLDLQWEQLSYRRFVTVLERRALSSQVWDEQCRAGHAWSPEQALIEAGAGR